MTSVSVSHMWVYVRLNNNELRKKKKKKKDEQGREGHRKSGKKKGAGRRGGARFIAPGRATKTSVTVVIRQKFTLWKGRSGEKGKRGGVRTRT